MPPDHARPDAGPAGEASFADLRARLLEIVREKGHALLDEPVRLASGQLSRHFVDGKAALADGADLAVACRAILALAEHEGVEFDAAGGMTMGADHLAHGVALLGGRRWFVVRKAAKGRGTDRLVEGDRLGAGTRVLLVDDVVSTGGSIARAHEAVTATGAEVVLATTLLDRGGTAAATFARLGVPYRPLLTYHDLGMGSVGAGGGSATQR